MNYTDIIFQPNNNEELIESQKMGLKYGYIWPHSTIQIKYYNIQDCKYIIFSTDNEKDNSKNMFSYSTVSIEDLIQSNLPYNHGNYKYIDSLLKLKSEFSGTRQIDYNEPRKLVYENKILKYNQYNK